MKYFVLPGILPDKRLSIRAILARLPPHYGRWSEAISFAQFTQQGHGNYSELPAAKGQVKL